jgi:hypothetical protein
MQPTNLLSTVGEGHSFYPRMQLIGYTRPLYECRYFSHPASGRAVSPHDWRLQPNRGIATVSEPPLSANGGQDLTSAYRDGQRQSAMQQRLISLATASRTRREEAVKRRARQT